MSTKKNPGPKERDIQKSFFQWLSYYPYIRKLTTHIPNGGSRDIREARNLKAQGVSPGWPDVFIAIPSKSEGVCYNGLFLEIKSKYGCLSLKQQNIHGELRLAGYMVHTCRTLESCIEKVKLYLGGTWDVKQPTVSGKNIETGLRGYAAIF